MIPCLPLNKEKERNGGEREFKKRRKNFLLRTFAFHIIQPKATTRWNSINLEKKKREISRIRQSSRLFFDLSFYCGYFAGLRIQRAGEGTA